MVFKSNEGRKAIFRVPVINPLDHLGMLYQLAIKYGANKPIEDSWQYSDGMLGLLRAAREWTPTRDVKFSTLAWKYIEYAIWNNRTRRDGGARRAIRSAMPFSQLGDEEFDLGTIISDKSNSSLELNEFLSKLDKRTARLVRRAYLEQYTLMEAGAMEEPPITRERVRQLVSKGIKKMQRIAGV